MRTALALVLCLIAACATAAPRAKTGTKPASQDLVATKPAADSVRETARPRPDQTVVTIMAGAPGSTDLAIAADLADVLDDGDQLRVLPIVGKGATQSVKDVMFLRGVDMGITQANVLKHLAATGERGSNFENEIVYVAKLFNEEVHVLARREVGDIGALAGKPVSLGVEGSGGAITGRLLFEALGIGIEPLHLADADAIAKLKSGEIDAAVIIAGKPASMVTKLSNTDGLQLLAVPYPKALEDSYYPASLSHDDYPELINEGPGVDTVSVCAVLISFNWPQGGARYRRVAKFVDAFFGSFDAFLKAPRHPKWREVNFAATLENWRRSPAAEAWIDAAQTKTETASRRSFDSFLAEAAKDRRAPISSEERAELFRAFQEWSKDRTD